MLIEKQNINVIKSLLARTDTDTSEMSLLPEQKSALNLAVEIGNFEIIKLLIEKKEIDIYIEDSQGKKNNRLFKKY